MRPQYSLVTPPATEPITIDQASAHLRVDSSDDLDYIVDLIAVAREYVEDITGRVCGVSGWRLIAPSWPALVGDSCGSAFSLYRTPLVSVESISYYAPDTETLTVMDSGDYRVIIGAEPGMIQIVGSLPSVDSRPDAIQIEFTAGYADAGLVPAQLRHAVKMLVSHLYENRLPVAFASCQSIPFTLETLISNQKIGGWIV